MPLKPTKQTSQIEEKAFVWSRHSSEAVEIGVIIPQAILMKLSSEQIERIVDSFILELAGITLENGQNESSSFGIN